MALLVLLMALRRGRKLAVALAAVVPVVTRVTAVAVAVPEVSDSALLKAYTTASNGEILSHSWRPIFLRYARIGIAAILAAKEKK